MLMSKLIGERYKEKPAEATIDSHALMVRGGYIKQVTNGIYTLYTPAKRIARKIEDIMRQEMDAIGAQEVTMPVVMPASLWESSGRYESVGVELMRMDDRSGNPMVLGMTHEEAAVDMVKDIARSYNQFPLVFYQIQTKFRDELRSRAGLIRVREFTMKDAYSFHTSVEDLQRFYDECFDAYVKIFTRCGVPDVVPVVSDSGMMGGSMSHEFMLLTDIGEDTIVICPDCGYRSNMEAAPSIIKNQPGAQQPLVMVETPGVESIEDLCDFLHIAPQQTMKAVVYQKNADDDFVIVFIRGDLDVNETKLRNFLGEGIHPARDLNDARIQTGYIGAYGLDDSLTVVFDSSLVGIEALACGANKKGYHYTGFAFGRDIPTPEFVDVAKAVEGGICPDCGKPVLTVSKGIEVGNIFQLGTKYTASMGMEYVDQNDEKHHPIMGSYGIGVGRLMASVCEARHDQYGPLWPISIAPWQVHIVGITQKKPEVKQIADDLYQQVLAAGFEAVYDDRQLSPGVMFADADLLGVPIRLIVSPKNLAEGMIEVVTRDKAVQKKVPVADIIPEVKALYEELAAPLR